MDADSTQGRDNERNARFPYVWGEFFALTARQQPRHLVLRSNFIDHDIKYDIDKHDINNGASHHYNVGGYHHHHGPNDDDILIHDHDGPDNHHHAVLHHDFNGDDYEYGPADHDHRPEREVVIDNQLVKHNDPYGHDDSDNIIDTPGHGV